MKKILFYVLLWSPLGLYIYPKHYMFKGKKPDWSFAHGMVMGAYIGLVIIFLTI